MKRVKIGAVSASLLLFTVAGCTSIGDSDGAYTERGGASWYGKDYHGRLTASGERFDRKAFTAAHKTLPFGTVVEVTRKSNGKSVRVRINDRGPFVRGRIIDLSQAAAKRLDMINDGVADVELTVVAWGG